MLVVVDLLVERGRETHGETTVNLTLDDHRVDDRAAVIDRDEAADLHFAGATVDVDDADVRPEGESEVRRVVVVDRLEPRLHALRVVGVGRERDLLHRLRLGRDALDLELVVLPLDVVGVRLEQVRRDEFRLLPNLARRDRRGPARDRCAPAGVRAEAVRRGIGVALFDGDIGDRDPELLRDDLPERRLMPLALRLHADPDHDLAGWVHANLGGVEHLDAEDVEVLRGAGADDLGEGRDADAHELSALALLGLFLAQFGVADLVHRELERAAVVA